MEHKTHYDKAMTDTLESPAEISLQELLETDKLDHNATVMVPTT